jgi:carbamoyl-phosphate synthase large subunit
MNLVIISAGKFGREVFAWAMQAIAAGAPWRLKGFLDGRSHALNGYEYQPGIVGDVSTYCIQEDDVFIGAIGDPADKRKFCTPILERGGRFVNLIHPLANIGVNVRLGSGIILAPFVSVTADVTLGDHVAMGTFSSVAHDAAIGDWCQISNHCGINGKASLGEGVFLGSHACVIPEVRVGAWAFVGAGSVVIQDVAPRAKVFGNPARPIGKSPAAPAMAPAPQSPAQLQTEANTAARRPASDAGINLLFTSVGRRGYLLEYFRAALAGKGLVHAGNSSISPAFLEADRTVITPPIQSEGYIDFLLSYCATHRIKAVFPLFDVDIPILARNAGRFREAGVIVATPPEEMALICNDKWATAGFLRQLGVRGPATFLGIEAAKLALERGELAYPVIVKPRRGYGSIGLYRASNSRELAVFFEMAREAVKRRRLASEDEAAETVIVQEFIDGEEYNLDVANDLEGNYVATFVEKKLAMRAGETDEAVSAQFPLLTELGRTIATALQHKGNLDVDLLLDAAGPAVLELNPRFGGAYPFAHLAGADLPRAIVSWLAGEPADPACFQMQKNIRGIKTIRAERQSLD